jgi:hypothetical protein
MAEARQFIVDYIRNKKQVPNLPTIEKATGLGWQAATDLFTAMHADGTLVVVTRLSKAGRKMKTWALSGKPAAGSPGPQLLTDMIHGRYKGLA